MYRSLIFKEWIKTRRFILLSGVAFAALIAYIFLWLAQTSGSMGIVNLWETIISKEFSLVGHVKYLPLAVGLLLAVVQLAPEMQSKRLKLTLHLPMNETRIICTMLGYGLATLLMLFTLATLALVAGISVHFSREIALSNFLTALPWFLGGLQAYLLCAWICLEPVWRQRIFYAIPAACVLFSFYGSASPGAYVAYLPFMLFFIAASFFFSLHAAARFKDGEQ
ncbi:MAG: hypothetical protein LBH84_05010 [Prevotellaceae bacterium]|jgi:hypothetical protein|nr:hypothetical protein [Prevotellaceae bacterium]